MTLSVFVRQAAAIPFSLGASVWHWGSRVFKLLSGEFLLNRRPNGGDIVFLRSLISAALLFVPAAAIKLWVDTGILCGMCVLREMALSLPWFGAIFGAIYIGLYSRFSSQWTYLANLYNQMMASQVLMPFAAGQPSSRTYIVWWAAFIEDAEDVHLALKKNYAAVIVGLTGDARIREAYAHSTVGGARRLQELELKLESVLGYEEFRALKASGEALAKLRQTGVESDPTTRPSTEAASGTAPLTSPSIEDTRSSGASTTIRSSPLYPWKIKVNSQYQRIIDLIISLAVASLVLPPLFLRDFFGVRDEPLAIFLDDKVFWSWGLLSLAIFLGISFHYASAKWVKHAWGMPVRMTANSLELVLDLCFFGCSASFIGGLLFFLAFIRE
jgi:hypothetical protein